MNFPPSHIPSPILDFSPINDPLKTTSPSDFEKSEFIESCGMLRFVIDVIIRCITILITLSIALMTVGFTTHRWEVFVTNSAVNVILGLSIWRTYRLANGFLVYILLAEKRFSSLPDACPSHLFVKVGLSRWYQKRIYAAISSVYPHVPTDRFPQLAPAHIGTPTWLVYGSVTLMVVFNCFMAHYYAYVYTPPFKAEAVSQTPPVPGVSSPLTSAPANLPNDAAAADLHPNTSPQN